MLAEYVEHYRGLRERARAQEPGLPEVPDEFLRALVGGIAELVQKAGTLTVGTPEVREVLSADGGTPTELLRLAACFRRQSTWP